MKVANKGYLFLLLPTGALMALISASFPAAVERYYSNGINKITIQGLSIISGLIPYSIAELVAGLFIGLAMFSVGQVVKQIRERRETHKQILTGVLLRVFVFISIAYFCFIALWGLNYYRLPFSEIANFQMHPATTEELFQVAESLIDQANKLREKVEEDKSGVMQVAGTKTRVFDRATEGYEKAAQIYSELGGVYGRPKGVFLSKIMAYTGISGVYFPFTGEPNVNTAIPDSQLPSTVCHEMAHQRGFAREDEANYIAYLTCRNHPDVDFKYSGLLLALNKTMKMLRDNDPGKYELLQKKYSAGIKRDLRAWNEFYDRHEGPVQEISSDINDIFLKSNGQEEGIKSYNLMVRLLIGEYRAKKAK